MQSNAFGFNTSRAALLIGIFLLLSASFTLFGQQASPSGSAPAATSPKTATTPEDKPQTATGASTPALSEEKKPVEVPGLDSKTGIPLYETIQEDWSSLEIGTSNLKPAMPVFGYTDETDKFTRTLVQLKWRPGDGLDLYVIMPKGVKNPPAVLYLYGYKDDTDRFRNDGWCERATSGGTAAIGFVSALSGQRFHDRPLEQWFVSELQESLGSTVHDVKFILDFLADSGEIDMSRIGMFGQSSGGAIALLTAAADQRIKAVEVLDPWGDWPVWLAKSPVTKEDIHGTNFATPGFEKKVENLDPVKWLPTLQSKKVEILQVTGNAATPAEAQKAIRDAAPKNAEVVVYDKLADLVKADSGGHIFDWVKTALNQMPAAENKSQVAADAGPKPEKVSKEK